jgi:P-type conjugative transfer protein TrbJ
MKYALFRRTLLPGLLTATAFAGAMSAAPAQAQFGGVVYDPKNYSQNILTAARTLEQINNQIRMLQNQATSLVNDARNLTSLPISTLQTLQAQVDQTRQLLGEAQRIAYDVTDIQQAFSSRYKGGALTGTHTQMVANADARWCRPASSAISAPRGRRSVRS